MAWLHVERVSAKERNGMSQCISANCTQASTRVVSMHRQPSLHGESSVREITVMPPDGIKAIKGENGDGRIA